MIKYNVGDVLEITEDFVLEDAQFSGGEDYTVVESDGIFYSLESDECYFINSISLVDDHTGFRKVEPKAEFKVGDKVRLLESAHSSPGYSCDTPELVKERLASAGLDYQTVFEVDKVVDSDGDVHVYHEESFVGMFVLAEFLVPRVEEEEEQSPIAETVPEEGAKVVGVVKPIPPVECAHDKPLNSLAEEVEALATGETLTVDALREAYGYLIGAEYPDIEVLIKLARRLK